MSASKAEIIEFMKTNFPQSQCVVEEIIANGAIVSHDIGFNQLRPYGTVAGPVLMAIADVAIYVAILGKIGIVSLAVTTSFNINFLRKPVANSRIIAHCNLIKTGKTLIIGEVSLYSEANNDLVAHAVATYAIPKEP